MLMLPALILGLAVAAAPLARAAAPAPVAVDPASAGMIDLLKSACLDFATRSAMRRVWLDTHLTQAESRNEKFFLGSDPGRVWVQKGKSGNYAVIVYDSGLCAIKADRGNLASAFHALDGADWPGFTLARNPEPPPKAPPAIGPGEVESSEMKAQQLRDLTNTPHTYTVSYTGKTGTISGFVLPPASFMAVEFTFMPAQP